jgi:hypothetical protein
MKKIVLLFSAFMVVNQVSAFPFYDPFADKTGSGGSGYSAGSPLATQGNGSDVWNLVASSIGSTEPLIAAGSLSYTNMPQSSGNSVTFTGVVSKGDRLNFNATIMVTNTRAYYSYLLKLTDLSTVPATAATNHFTGFSDGNAGQTTPVLRTAARVVVEKSGSGYLLGMGRNNNPADNVYATNVFTTNDVVLVVASYDRIGGVTNINLWLNPPGSSFGSNNPPGATLTMPLGTAGAFTGDINATGGGLIQGFCIVNQSPLEPSGIIDEVRIGTNWSFVTGGDPAILQNPTNRIVASGNNASFNVVARGTPTLGYQWYKDGTTPLNDGGNLSGTHTATLTVSAVSGGDAGSYSVFVTNGVGNFVQSSGATLSLITDPLITGQPQNVTTNFGTTAKFQVIATGTAPLRYQWHKQFFGDLTDGGNVSGSQTNVLTLAGVATADAGGYYVTVSNNIAQVDSDTVTLTVLDPYISTQPVSVTTNAGGTAVFHAVATGSGSLGYSWLKNGNVIFGGVNIFGANTDTLTISNVSSADQAGYSMVANGSGSITSSVASLTVLSSVSITVQPQPRTILTGTRAVFAVVAGGSGSLAYQWQKGGANISGATSTSYVLANAQPAMNGNYSVVVSNSFSSITSSIVPLTVSSSLTLADTNLVVVRVGDGDQVLTVNGNSMYLDQYATDGTYINTITIPEDGSSSMVAIGWDNISGVQAGSTTGTVLTRSLDGRFIVVAGYHTNLNYGASLNNSTSATVPKGIALIDSYGQYTLAVADTNSTFDSSLWRSGIADGTNNYWGGANLGGTYYFGFDAAPALIQNTMVNMRSMALFNGDIYAVGAATPNGVLKINGMPKTNSTATLLFTGSSGSFDLAVSPNGNLIYVTDQRGLGNGGGVQRYDFDGSNWNLSYTLNTGFANVGPRYVTADFSGGNPVIYVTSNEQSFDNDRIIKIVDTGAGSAGTTLVYAGVNQTFRSIRFGPVQNPIAPRPLLSGVRDGNTLILSWSGAFNLQSSLNVTGVYTNITAATSPYTNAFGPAPQRFFRLKN